MKNLQASYQGIDLNTIVFVAKNTGSTEEEPATFNEAGNHHDMESWWKKHNAIRKEHWDMTQ